MKRNTITLALLATLMIASINAYQVETDISKTNVIVTTGNAEIRVKPDIATIFVYLTA
jgi:uncharacterized protein YggE